MMLKSVDAIDEWCRKRLYQKNTREVAMYTEAYAGCQIDGDTLCFC